MKYNFEILKQDSLNIIEYENTINETIFNSTEWIEFIKKDIKAEPIFIKIYENDTPIAYFTAFKKKYLFFSIIGSPFRGWSTCYMGITFISQEFNPINIYKDLIIFLFKEFNPIFFECIDTNLSVESLKESNYFKYQIYDTLVINLKKNIDELFNSFKGDCRTYIRQFDKRGAKVEIAEPDDFFANEYYNQLIDVFKKQNSKPTYNLEKVKNIFYSFRKSDKILCLRVKDITGKCIATSIYIGYNKVAFFWGGASYSDYQFYRPNEIMIWYAMKYWKNKGFEIFDMVGVRDYKLKFSPKKTFYPRIFYTKFKLLYFLRIGIEKMYTMFRNWNIFSIINSKTNKVSGNMILKSYLSNEITHFFHSGQKIIYSNFNKVYYETDSLKIKINLPINIFQKILGRLRFSRRMFRLDKSVIEESKNGLIIFWQKNVYHYNFNTSKLSKTLNLNNCRNPMHNSIANVDGLNFYFGEYGKPSIKGKNVYHSNDGGINWNIVYNIACTKIRHIHSCKFDPFENKIWVLTGDFDGQCYILISDLNFKNIEWIGDGTQKYRAVDIIFKDDNVHWIMDSPIENVNHIVLSRNNRTIEVGQSFPGPVWYLKELTDNIILASTVQEIGPSHKDDLIHIYATRNLKKWVSVANFNHDGYKKGLFKFGVGTFSNGPQSSESICMHFEAVKKFDGKSAIFKLKGI